MRATVLLVASLLLLAACESDESKKCNAVCDEEAKRGEQCGGPGAEACKKAIDDIVTECRAACKELVK